MNIPDLGKVFPESAVKSASRVPAYAFVFLIAIVLIVVGIEVRLTAAILIIVAVLVLTILAIWAIDVRSTRTVTTESPAQTQRLEEVKKRDAPLRTVLDCLVADETDVYVVYSSTEVREFVDQLGATVRPDDLAYGGGPEKRVTTIPDARGAARLHNLLYLGGKRKRLQSVTSWPDDFKQEWWDGSLILIGSGKSNRITTVALKEHKSPYCFSEDFESIVDLTDQGSRWPASKDDLKTVDYGLLVKLKIERDEDASVYLVAAGVGPYGTLAGCVFLDRETERIATEYGSSPFAYILSITRDDLGSFTPKVERHCALPVVRG